MAIIRRGSQDIILREITGKLGDVVIQNRHGKTIIYSKRKRTVVSQTVKSVTARKRFRSATMLAVFLNKIPALSAIWKAAKIQGTSGYTRIMKYNAAACNPEGPTNKNIITPPLFHFRIKELILHEDQIGIIMEDWFQTEENDECIMILVLYEPVQEKECEFVLMDISPVKLCNLEISLNYDQLIRCRGYRRFRIYAAVYRKVGREIKWSNTVSIGGKWEL